MKNTKKLIKKLGGYKHIASVLNEDLEAIYKWGQRGIPTLHWYRVMLAFNVDIDTLHKIKVSDTPRNR